MYKVLILAVLLTLGACVVKKSTVHIQDTKTVLAELDKDTLGNTLLSAIAINMKAKEPMEEITLFIEEIINGINQAQSEADAKNQTEEAVCQEQQASFNKQIAEQISTIASLESSITENSIILQQATVDLEQANKDYDEVVSAIQAGTAQREAEHSVWADQDYKQSVQIATLEEGVKLIQHMIHGVAFAQIKTRYEKVLEKLQQDEGKHSNLFKPLILQLTQLATKLNYENVMKILDLLNGIREAIVQDQAAARIAEETAQADWEVLLAQLETQKRSLSDKKQRLNNLIDSTTQLLKQLKESLEQHRVELENLQLSLASVVDQCTKSSQFYLSETSQRSSDLSVLNKLLTHLNERGGAVGDYVQNREI